MLAVGPRLWWKPAGGNVARLRPRGILRGGRRRQELGRIAFQCLVVGTSGRPARSRQARGSNGPQSRTSVSMAAPLAKEATRSGRPVTSQCASRTWCMLWSCGHQQATSTAALTVSFGRQAMSRVSSSQSRPVLANVIVMSTRIRYSRSEDIGGNGCAPETSAILCDRRPSGECRACAPVFAGRLPPPGSRPGARHATELERSRLPVPPCVEDLIPASY